MSNACLYCCWRAVLLPVHRIDAALEESHVCFRHCVHGKLLSCLRAHERLLSGPYHPRTVLPGSGTPEPFRLSYVVRFRYGRRLSVPIMLLFVTKL